MRKKEAKIERKANRARQGAVRLSELTKEQKAALISELVQEIKREEEIPASVFDNEKLSCLEAIAKYLREQKGWRYVRIARALNRSDKTIWLTYQKAKRKMPGTLTVEEGAAIPLSKIADRRCAVLEAVIAHLKEHYGLEYKQIARMLKRSYSTIAGTYRRHKGK